jgi:hypothetical protein
MSAAIPGGEALSLSIYFHCGNSTMRMIARIQALFGDDRTESAVERKLRLDLISAGI